nr:hypothetical protein CFP56_43337 [Quercus suber]
MDVYQLQWYGYCLFRALACLHKQDLQSKYTIASKSKASHNVSINQVIMVEGKAWSRTAILNRPLVLNCLSTAIVCVFY